MDDLSLHSQEPDLEEFWRVAKPEKEPVRWRFFLPVMGLLLLVNVPWYLSPEVAEGRTLGLPLFVWICLGTSLAMSVLTCAAALWHWKSEEVWLEGNDGDSITPRGKG